jgi:hypothetical protein
LFFGGGERLEKDEFWGWKVFASEEKGMGMIEISVYM